METLEMTTTTKYTTINSEIYDSNNHIKVIWEDTLDNYSSVRERQVLKYFVNKYKTNKVKVVFKPISSKSVDLNVEGSVDASELILDENYQKQLINKYINDNKVNVPMDYILRLDKAVNVELEDYKDNTNRYKKFQIKEIEFSNFLSYGENNVISFEGNPGITSITSEPVNYGGKTSGSLDLLLFLFFGETTKTERNEDIFNKFVTDSNVVSVKGTICIEGEDFIIKRNIIRKENKDGGYTCKSELDFLKVLPQGGTKQLNGDEKRATEELIKNYVGTYDDFLITILTTGDNLLDLIKTKPTERGRILTRFIGLEFFREKEKIGKKLYTEWKEKSKLHRNNVEDIKAKIEVENDKIKQNTEANTSNNNKLSDFTKTITNHEKENNDCLLKRINNVDNELYKLNESDILSGITKVTDLIKSKQLEIDNLSKSIPKPESDFDIDLYNEYVLKVKELNDTVVTNKANITNNNNIAITLKDSEVCQSCMRPLDGIDNTQKINDLVSKTSELVDENIKLTNRIANLNKNITDLTSLKDVWAEYDKNRLLIDKFNMELTTYNDSLNRGNEKLKLYRDNIKNIENNQKIDTDIQRIKYQLDSVRNDRDSLILNMRSIDKDIELSNNRITEYNELIVDLKREEEIDKIYRVYLDIYGKNGISKMVLSTMMPLINIHLKTLLIDSAEFTLEMRMNDKSEVNFWMIDNETLIEKQVSAGSGYEKTISSLALRCVLSKVCSLPKPNIIIFDEVTGMVGNNNLDKIGLFFDKIRQFFDHIWIISHNPLVQDWADKTIVIKKENNISKIINN